MIDTKEQYEEVRKGWHFADGAQRTVKENTALVETIEALREAVWKGGRAIEYLQSDPQGVETQATIMEWEDTRDKLPHWLLREDQ